MLFRLMVLPVLLSFAQMEVSPTHQRGFGTDTLPYEQHVSTGFGTLACASGSDGSTTDTGLAAAGAGGDASRKDLKLLQGTWVLAAMEANGKEVPVEKLQHTILIIKEDTYTVKIKDKVMSVVRIKLDAAKDPRQIDMTFTDGAAKDKVGKGIYLITGDTFKMCRGLDPDQDRPREFATWPDTNVFVVTWKRQPPGR